MSRCNYDDASWISHLFFTWAKAFVDDTNYTTEFPESLKPDDHYDALKNCWKAQLQKENPSFFRAMVRAFTKRLFMDTLVFSIDVFCQVIVGLLVGYLIEFIQEYTGDDFYTGFLYAIGIGICLFVSFLTKHLAFLKGHFRSGVIKQSVQRMVHQKLLKLSHSVVNAGGVSGKVINIASMDVEIMEFIVVLNFLWISPFAAVVVTIVILIIIGVPGLFGILIMCLLVPIQTRINKLNTNLRVKVNTRGDRRIKETTEIIEGIRVLKMYGWEEAYSQHIMEARNAEVSMNRIRVCIRGSNMTLFLIAQGLAVLATFSGFLLFDEEVRPKDIFTVLSLFVTAQFYLTVIFPFATELVSTYMGSCKRITDFLLLEETEPTHEEYHRGEIKLKNVSARYAHPKEGEEEQRVLDNISVRFPQGELTFVIGEVGSGKSSLLLSILGEIYKTGGTVYRGGKISYIEQEPWILSGTLKENITLGREYNADKMQQILQCTGLADDLKVLENGMDTLIGERGTNLSGGQKARVSMARGLYSDADIYLLDDPLSAVDVKVGRLLFDSAICEYLRGKTRVLVTHQVQFITPDVRVYRMSNGQAEKVSGAKVDIETHPHQELEPETIGQGAGNETSAKSEEYSSSIFKTFPYLWKGWKWSVPLLALLYPITMLLYLMVPFWLAYWSEQDDLNSDIEYYLSVLGFIVLALFVVGLIRNNLMAQSLQTASKNLHNEAIGAIARFPSNYFDKNSTGKIMGYMSNDINKMDEMIPWMTTDFYQVLFITIGSIIAMVIGNFIMVVFLIPLAFGLYYFFNKGFAPTQVYYTAFNETKAPIFNHLSTVSSGLFAIRALGVKKDFGRLFNTVTSNSFYKFFAYHSCARWMHFHNDMVGTLFLISNVVIACALIDFVDKVLLATGLSLLLIVAVNLVWTMFQLSQNKNFMVSCVRMMDYIKQEQEGALRGKEDFVITQGQIQFKNVNLRYGESRRALKSLSLKFRPGEKVGIVGRTGAGKSSIIVCLFRLTEIESGKILIDGVDSSKLGLHTLRKQIAAIPQSPFIFTATVRYNLDPFQEYTDDELWNVLKVAHLKKKIESLPDQLSSEMSPTMLSVGQKQLLCLARALLRKSKILVMDEATANVDNETDKKIHKAIDEYFRNSTVIVIAHRLNTIIQCDKIVVMSEGRCNESGSPAELLDDPESFFYNMVMMTGDHAQSLIKKAKRGREEDLDDLHDISIS